MKLQPAAGESASDSWLQHSMGATYPTSDEIVRENSGNTTHGSGWIVQVQPMLGRTRDSGIPPGIAPTAVGGLFSKSRGRPSCRPHLNDPPTAVAGTPEVFHSLLTGGMRQDRKSTRLNSS